MTFDEVLKKMSRDMKSARPTNRSALAAAKRDLDILS
jgi:hypothetical protein